MKATLVPNPGYDSETVPYLIQAEIVNATIDAGSTFEIPVKVSHNGIKKDRFEFEICGFERTTTEAPKLPAMAAQLLRQLINLARFPSYVFVARHANDIFPVYTIGNEVFATTPGGPVFRHVELAKVRGYLSDYLHEVGVLGEEGFPDKLHVRGVHPHTLQLQRPVFYLKKRVPGQIDFWAPVFESDDGRRIYTYAASARREVPIEAGQEVISLRELVAQLLLTQGRLENPYDLRPDRLTRTYWESLQGIMESKGRVEIQGIPLELYMNSYLAIGLEVRQGEEERFSIFAGEDLQDVQDRATVDFERRGLFVAEPA